MTTAIILAAGKSERMGKNVDKAFLSLVDKPVVAWSLLAFERCADIDRIVLVVRKEQQLAAKEVCRMFGISKLDKIVSGGLKRQDSVLAGLAACDLDTRVVAIHDAARALITSVSISEVVRSTKRGVSVTIGRPVTDTVKRCAATKGASVVETLDREHLWAVQTPQAFQMRDIRAAYAALGKKEVTDDCQVVELNGGVVKIVPSLAPNFKITTVEDLQIAAALLK
ncbi:MAG: 2-C-methyl-D-erythritol 4-phosphate cytidylyltransferase [Kiritimatiellae bacterium]|nr:2-C-methyl-D-erythritol 4-phosphate cytidylyltransferase [Kiritimatiellia bacterium]